MSPAFDILFPTTLVSKCIHDTRKNILSCKVRVNWTGGGLRFFISNSGSINASPNVWEEIPLANGIEAAWLFSLTGHGLYYRILKDPDTIIYTTTNALNQVVAPGIEIRDIVTE